MEPHADGRPTYPKGIVNDTYHFYPSATQPLARYRPPWLGYTRAPLASIRQSNPLNGVYPPQTLLPPT